MKDPVFPLPETVQVIGFEKSESSIESDDSIIWIPSDSILAVLLKNQDQVISRVESYENTVAEPRVQVLFLKVESIESILECSRMIAEPDLDAVFVSSNELLIERLLHQMNPTAPLSAVLLMKSPPPVTVEYELKITPPSIPSFSMNFDVLNLKSVASRNATPSSFAPFLLNSVASTSILDPLE